MRTIYFNEPSWIRYPNDDTPPQQISGTRLAVRLPDNCPILIFQINQQRSRINVGGTEFLVEGNFESVVRLIEGFTHE